MKNNTFTSNLYLGVAFLYVGKPNSLLYKFKKTMSDIFPITVEFPFLKAKITDDKLILGNNTFIILKRNNLIEYEDKYCILVPSMLIDSDINFLLIGTDKDNIFGFIMFFDDSTYTRVLEFMSNRGESDG